MTSWSRTSLESEYVWKMRQLSAAEMLRCQSTSSRGKLNTLCTLCWRIAVIQRFACVTMTCWELLVSRVVVLKTQQESEEWLIQVSVICSFCYASSGPYDGHWWHYLFDPYLHLFVHMFVHMHVRLSSVWVQCFDAVGYATANSQHVKCSVS